MSEDEINLQYLPTNNREKWIAEQHLQGSSVKECIMSLGTSLPHIIIARDLKIDSTELLLASRKRNVRFYQEGNFHTSIRWIKNSLQEHKSLPNYWRKQFNEASLWQKFCTMFDCCQLRPMHTKWDCIYEHVMWNGEEKNNWYSCYCWVP